VLRRELRPDFLPVAWAKVSAAHEAPRCLLDRGASFDRDGLAARPLGDQRGADAETLRKLLGAASLCAKERLEVHKRRIFKPKVMKSQQPMVAMQFPNLWFMNQPTEKADFATRLNEICSDLGLPAERGRQTALAKQFGVSPTAARKWLLGDGLPEMEMAIRIAKWADVNFEWLMTGRGPKSGDKLPTRALVVDEIMRRGTPEERRELVNFIKYKIEHATTPIAAEERARYEGALSTYVSDQRKQARH